VHADFIAAFWFQFAVPSYFDSPRHPMPHHRVLPSQFTLRRLSTLVNPQLQHRILLSSPASSKPLLPFLWPAQNYHYLHHRSLARKLSTTSYRRATDAHEQDFECDDDMSKEGKKGGKNKGGNFQLKTPKGTRDCMVNTCLNSSRC
jgi:histidyl-tRNA synthetase